MGGLLVLAGGFASQVVHLTLLWSYGSSPEPEALLAQRLCRGICIPSFSHDFQVLETEGPSLSLLFFPVLACLPLYLKVGRPGPANKKFQS